MYKISICCEYNGQQLMTYNNKSIYPNIRGGFNSMFKCLKPSLVKFINNVNILHKDRIEETTTEYRTLSVKHLEVLCNREINKYEFEWFIYYLKLCGFNTCSETNTIMCWSSDGEIIHNYNFKYVIPVFKNRRKKNIDWNYKTQYIV